jgi:hypothetical protein
MYIDYDIFMGMGRYNYTKALDRLTTWANKEGYEVILDHDSISEITWVNRTLNWPNKIYIQKNPVETMVYLLLHELGHHVLRKDWTRFKELLPISAEAEDKHFNEGDDKYKRRVVYQVSCLEEEFKAWDEGYRLGRRMGIRINDDKWHNLRGGCLLSYMRFYANKTY